MIQRIGTLVFGFALFVVSDLRGADHPADTNSDQRITTAEIQSYWTNGFGAMLDDEKRAEENWQQGEFLWRNGERYRDEASLVSPFGWLPLAGNWGWLSPVETLTGLPWARLPAVGSSMRSAQPPVGASPVQGRMVSRRVLSLASRERKESKEVSPLSFQVRAATAVRRWRQTGKMFSSRPSHQGMQKPRI